MISEVAHKLLSLVANPDHSLRDLVKIVENDVYIAARLLRVANSAYFSRGHEITTVQRAVTHLGEATVLSIALGASTGDLLTRPLAGYESEAGGLWAHCLIAAIAARKVALLVKNPKVTADQAYTAAMLMDIGMAVLADHLAGETDKMIESIDTQSAQDFLDAEEHTAGANHAKVGGEIARMWNLPRPLIAAIEHHHHPSEGPEELFDLLYAVHVADIITRMAGYGMGVETLSYTLDEGYRAFIPLDKPRIESLMLDVLDEFSKIEKFILE